MKVLPEQEREEQGHASVAQQVEEVAREPLALEIVKRFDCQQHFFPSSIVSSIVATV